MKTTSYASVWIRRFLMEYLISIRNLSKNTQLSYRDTFRLLLPFASMRSKVSIDKLMVEDIAPEIIKGFLTRVESERNCSLATRNQRLSAVHSFAKFVGLNCPEHMEWCRQVNMIPFKKTKRTLITYLEKPEMNALLDAPDSKSEQGKRDHAILLFLYNTGARADEVAQLMIKDLSINSSSSNSLSTVLIKGKGNKSRRCPLWQQTKKEVSLLIAGREASEHVFLNRLKQPITRFGIHNMVKRYVDLVAAENPSIRRKKVSPHTIRHTTATHLLQAGVDINTIRAWLGHVSINTTNIYAEVDLNMKAKALACCEIEGNTGQNHWRDKKDLMAFLDAL